MFKPTKAKSVAECLRLIPEPRKTEMRQLHDFIQKTLPAYRPYFANNMIGYGTFPYRFANGKLGTWPVIALASQKQYISVYVCAVRKGRYVAEGYKSDFPKANIGKSCIRFKTIEHIDLKKLAAVLREAAKYPGLVLR